MITFSVPSDYARTFWTKYESGTHKAYGDAPPRIVCGADRQPS